MVFATAFFVGSSARVSRHPGRHLEDARRLLQLESDMPMMLVGGQVSNGARLGFPSRKTRHGSSIGKLTFLQCQSHPARSHENATGTAGGLFCHIPVCFDPRHSRRNLGAGGHDGQIHLAPRRLQECEDAESIVSPTQGFRITAKPVSVTYIQLNTVVVPSMVKNRAPARQLSDMQRGNIVKAKSVGCQPLNG